MRRLRQSSYLRVSRTREGLQDNGGNLPLWEGLHFIDYRAKRGGRQWQSKKRRKAMNANVEAS